jgi:hypothetical protein
MDDIFNKAQATVEPTLSKPVLNGITVEGILFSSPHERSVAWNNGKTNGTMVTRSYTLVLRNIKTTLDDPSFSRIIRPQGRGFRLNYSGECKKAQLYFAYLKGLKQYVRDQQLTIDVDAAVAKTCMAGSPKKADDACRFTMDLSLPPFNQHPHFHFEDGLAIHFEKEKGQSFPPCVFVRVEGLVVAPYLPKKASDFGAEFRPFTVCDPDTGFPISLNLNASSITEHNTPYNKLPLEERIKTFFDMAHQHWQSPSQMQGKQACYALPLSPQPPGLSRDPVKGCHIGATTIAQPNLSGTVIYGPTEAEAYFIQRKDKRLYAFWSPVTGVNNYWVTKPTDDPAAIAEAMASYRLHEPQADGTMVHVNALKVHTEVWAEDTRSSGITNVETWVDLNTVEPLSAVAIVRPKTIQSSSETISMDPLVVVWDVLGRLKRDGIRVTHNFAKQLLGGTGTTPKVTLETETVKVDKVDKEQLIVNTGNVQHAQWLVNANELSEVPLAQYEKWEARVLILPVRRNITEEKTPERRAKRAKECADAIAACVKAGAAGPEAGDKAITAFVAQQLPKAELTDLSQNNRDFRFLVWFHRPEGHVVDQALVAKPYYLNFKPAPALVKIEPGNGLKRKERDEPPVAAETVPPPVVTKVEGTDGVMTEAAPAPVKKEEDGPATKKQRKE